MNEKRTADVRREREREREREKRKREEEEAKKERTLIRNEYVSDCACNSLLLREKKNKQFSPPAASAASWTHPDGVGWVVDYVLS